MDSAASGSADKEREMLLISALGKALGTTDVSKIREMIELVKTKQSSSIDLTQSVGGNGYSQFTSTHCTRVVITKVTNAEKSLKRWLDQTNLCKNFEAWGLDASRVKVIASLAEEMSYMSESVQHVSFLAPSGHLYFFTLGVLRNLAGQYHALISYACIEVTKAKQYFLQTRTKSWVFGSRCWQKWVPAPADSVGWTEEDQRQLGLMLKVQVGMQLVDVMTGKIAPWALETHAGCVQ